MREWLADVEVAPSDTKAVGQEILRNIGEVFSGLLRIEVSGEKDSEIVRTPVLMPGARVEPRSPAAEAQWKDATDWLAENVDDRHGSDHRTPAASNHDQPRDSRAP